MKIFATSDFHGYLPTIPECDLLLIGGDLCPVWDHNRQVQSLWLKSDFQDWLASVPAKHIVGIAGNHDFVLQDSKNLGENIKGWTYLQDTTVEIEGLKIHGAPWSPVFGNWAFMQPDNLLAAKWDLIPDDTDILLVHGPPYMTLDMVEGHGNYNRVTATYEKHVGSKSIHNRIDQLPDLEAIVCGHIHEAYGTMSLGENKPIVYNVSHVDSAYAPTQAPMEVYV